ncbi:MAG: AMP-binding protein [Rhodospirillales bacterium]|nr:AMP-binding protein [Rhodospirillales bacterium]
MGDWYQKERLGDLPAEAARRWGAREALVCDGARWTYYEYEREVDRVAKGLMALGVEKGEHVALWMNNRPEWLFLVFAIAKVGAVLVPLNTRYRTDDVAYTVRQSDSGTWISVDRSGPVDYAAMVVEVLPGLAGQDPHAVAIEGFPQLRRVVIVGESDVPGAVAWEAMLAGGVAVSDAALAARASAVDPDEPVMIGYTSGTTGHPKGVLHTHLMIRNMRERANRIGLTFEDVIVNPLPLFHMYGFSEAGLIAAIAGCKHVLLDRFDADECMRLVEAERGTITHGFDTHYKEYLDSLERTPRDISSLRFGTFPSGMTSSARIARRVQAEMVPTFTGWGMTETFTFATMSFGNSTPEQRSDASGFPAPGFEIKVVDTGTGREVAVGEEGELLIRGYMITQGYYKKPEETAEAIDGDGWLHTGDTVVLRADGHIRFVGRYKDQLRVGGENVSPAEVEAFLMAHQAIDQVAVVGYPDARLGEVALAFVVTAPGKAVTNEEIAAYCKGRIASFKSPRHVLPVDAFPMTASGKVQKHKLRKLALERLGDPTADQAAE